MAGTDTLLSFKGYSCYVGQSTSFDVCVRISLNTRLGFVIRNTTMMRRLQKK